MDSRAVDQQHHHNSHNVGSQEVVHGGEHVHHDHERKSVLTKVKQKAKKIKDTISKHGHQDHEHGHEYHYGDQHIPDDHDLDQEDDEDEHMVEDPEVHGAPIYDSAVRSAAPRQVNTLGKPGVNFGGSTLMREELHHEPRVVVVSPTTAINQSRSTDSARTFVGGEVNLARPMDLEEDPHAPRISTTQAYTPANYQTKITDPTGLGGAEIDITPVEKSFSRMTVHNEPKPSPQPKVLPTVAETHYPSAGTHLQFAQELSSATNYPSAESYGQYMPELSGEVKTQYPKSHDQFMPELSTPTKTQYASTKIHEQHFPQQSSTTKTEYPTQYPSTKIHDQHFPQQSSTTKTQYPLSHDQFTPELSIEPKIQHPHTKIHDQHLPQQYSATKTQYPSSLSHDQFASELSTEPKIQHPYTKTHDQHLPQQYSATKTQYPSSLSDDQFASTEPKIQHPYTKTNDQHLPQQQFAPELKTQYPSTESHDQFAPVLSTEPVQPYTKTKDQHLPQQSSATKTQYPSVGSHDQFCSELSTQPKPPPTYTTTTQVEEPHYNPTEKPSNESTYTDKISSATSTIADKAVTAKNAVASKLGYGDDTTNTETTQTRQHEENTGHQKPSTISSATSATADKAVSAKNIVASKLGYGDNTTNTETTQTRQHEENTGHQKPSTISSATSAIADKAVSAKNIVASKLGYGDNTTNTETTQTRHQEENTGNEKPSTISLATAAIADKAVSAKNTVTSKLGFGGDTDNKVTTTHQEKNNDRAASPTEYGKSVSASLTEKLAPVYGNVAGVGSGVKSKVSGTQGGKSAGVGVEQDKGVSVRDYLVEKMRPGDEDKALSEVISETLYKKEEPDGVHKREEEPERRVEHQRVLGKVTESEEVKRRLGSDKKTEKRYEEMYVNSPGKGVVDKLTGMVGSWFNNPGENQNQSSQDSSTNAGAGVEQVDQGAGERRLQEN